MADSMIQLSPDSTGKKVDTEELVVGANTVHRERMQIAGDSATDLAPVTALDGLTVNLGTNNDVTVASLPLPTGAATSANQATEIASLATIAGDTTDIEAAVELIDDTVAVLGTDTYTEATTKGLVVGAVRRDADTTLVNTTNEISPLQVDANGRLKVEAFSGETLPVSLAAGGTTQYAEDSAHVSGDLVTLAGVVQQSADAALSSDGDRSVMQVDSSGWLKVNIKAGAGSGGTAMVDDAAFTPATTSGTPAFALADETAPDSVDEGDAGALRMTLDRKLLTRVVGATDANRLDVDGSGHAQVDIAAVSVTVPVSAASLPLPTGAATLAGQTQPGVDIGDVTVNNASGASAVNVQDGGNSLTVDNAALSVVGGGVEATALRVTLASDSTGLVSVDDNGGSLTVDGTVGVSGSVDTELPAAAALADNTATPTAPAVGAFLMGFDGTNWDRLQTGAATGGALKVDGSAVTQPISGTVTANQGTAGAAWEIVGDVAADAAVPANPVIIGGRASTAQPTAVSADGDSVNEWMTRKGSPVVTMAPHVGIFSDPWALTGETAQYTTTQTSAVLVAGGASERLVVTKVQIQAGGTTAGTLQLYFGTGAYARGTNLAIFDGEFAPSATLKPGVVMDGPFISATNGDDILVTTSAAINPLTITVWYYVIT